MSTTPIYCAFFAATDDELAAAFPGWQRERTPDTEASVRIPIGPPMPFAFAPLPDRWWEHLLDYYLLVCPDDDEARQALYDESLNIDGRNEVVFPQALFAGPTAPFICRPRPAFLDASATLSDAQCDAIAKELVALYVPERFVEARGKTEPVDQMPMMDAYENAAQKSLLALRPYLSGRTKPIWFWGWFE